MANLLRCQDQWGRWIVLDADQWQDHVLTGHPELASYEHAVSATLTAPDYVTKDRQFLDREQFYRESILPTPYGRTYLKVCVEFDNDSGFVVTAFPSKRIHRKEVRRWP